MYTVFYRDVPAYGGSFIMNAKRLSWAFGLTLLVLVGAVGWATLTSRLAVVTEKNFTTWVPTDTRGMTEIQCQLVKYHSYIGEKQIVTGHSSGLPATSTVGGSFLHTGFSPAGQQKLIAAQMWGTVYFHRSGDYNSQPNWVTYGCLDAATNQQ